MTDHFGYIFGSKAERDKFEHELENIETFELQPMAKKRYDNALPQSVTTFYLPPKTLTDETAARDDIWILNDKGKQEYVTKALEAIPFPCIRIVREIIMPSSDDRWRRITTDVIVWSDGRYFTWAAKDTGYPTDGTGPLAMYSPHNKWGARERNIPMSYIDLIQTLADSRNRYQEQHVNRQTRRREGFSKDYREYIVIPNGKKLRDPNHMTRADIMRRHPRLHAVRGHIRQEHDRHYKSGQVRHIPASRVSEHARGGGPKHEGLLRVKEYIVEEEYVRS